MPRRDLADLDDAELADLTAAVEEIVTADDLAEAAARPPKAACGCLPAVQTLVGAVERRFPPASGILFLGTLRQVRRYLQDPQLKAEVDQITAEVAGGATVLIGHSLGSVVAYEFLRQNPGHSVRLLLTLGSPLGLRMVRDQLPADGPARGPLGERARSQRSGDRGRCPRPVVRRGEGRLFGQWVEGARCQAVPELQGDGRGPGGLPAGAQPVSGEGQIRNRHLVAIATAEFRR